MSDVSTVILMHDEEPDDAELSAKIAACFHSCCGKAPVNCEDESLPRGWYGGTKMLPGEVLVGAFNYFVIGDVLPELQKIAWTGPAHLVVRTENGTIIVCRCDRAEPS